MTIPELDKLWQGFLKIKKDPVMGKIVEDYLDIALAAHRGELNPEQMELYGKMNEEIHRLSQQQ